MTRPTGYPPVNPRFPFFWHGGDYNPDQWLHVPGTLDEDFRLFPLAHINSVSIAIFAWTALEPEEGQYEFGWLDDVMDRCAARKMAVVLATPSGAKPNWMASKYPEILRQVPAAPGHEPTRMTQHTRHNHCPTSPVYRQKCVAINSRLAERYANHPALALWHVSNEYGGECQCPLCIRAFRKWLQARYATLDRLNEAWWTGFWAHTYTDWDQIVGLDPSIESLMLDWNRFTTDQTVDFFLAESAPLRTITPAIPITVNMMGVYEGLDYWRFAPHVDVISWDSYPPYHDRPGETEELASRFGMKHDLNRSMKSGKPFLLMESSPGPVNWMKTNRLLRPGMHRMKSLQAVAHGSDSVQYFQLRKGRGGSEKFHGAVIDHVGNESPRMFAEVVQVGQDLQALQPVLGGATPAKVGLIYDWNVKWSLGHWNGPSAFARAYFENCSEHYRPFWKAGVAVDILNGDSPLEGYDVVIAPTLFLLRNGFAGRAEAFVRSGGTFVTTYLTGIVNEDGLAHTGGFPGPLRRLLGIWAEEVDYLYDDEVNRMTFRAGNRLGLTGSARLAHICDRIHAEGADVAATYDADFYAGEPALTVNTFGKGEAWYLAAEGGHDFLKDFYARLIARLGLPRALEVDQPEGIAAQRRIHGDKAFTFVTNFASEPREADLGATPRTDLLTGQTLAGKVPMNPYGVLVLA
jgi:beta-galactosidase